eukprot:scaffold20575_cov93-Isochrysis_galbana.AAC.3
MASSGGMAGGRPRIRKRVSARARARPPHPICPSPASGVFDTPTPTRRNVDPPRTRVLIAFIFPASPHLETVWQLGFRRWPHRLSLADRRHRRLGDTRRCRRRLRSRRGSGRTCHGLAFRLRHGRGLCRRALRRNIQTKRGSGVVKVGSLLEQFPAGLVSGRARQARVNLGSQPGSLAQRRQLGRLGRLAHLTLLNLLLQARLLARRRRLRSGGRVERLWLGGVGLLVAPFGRVRGAGLRETQVGRLPVILVLPVFGHRLLRRLARVPVPSKNRTRCVNTICCTSGVPGVSGTLAAADVPACDAMSGSKDGFMADPYANAASASSTTSDISKLGPAFGNAWSMPAAGSMPGASQPDFLFPETADDKYRRSWGDRLTYHIGLGYLTGAPPCGLVG